MAYGLFYKLPFKDLKNQNYTVEIEKEGYSGDVTELTGSDTPFTISIDDEDFLYTPTRFSTAKIGIIGSDYLQSLFSTQYQMFRVTLLKGTAPVWCGFISPENYSQDYVLSLFSYDVDCVSAMDVLDKINYKQVSSGEMSLVSLFDLLKQTVTESAGRYEHVYIPHVYAKTPEDYKAGDNILKELIISEQDFFDEEGKAMTYKDVLEAVCRFLNWTCVDWQGSLFFVDVDHTGDYYKYSADFSTFEMVSINSAVVQDEGFNGDGHTLDILGGYNKVTVKCSNYPVGDLFPKYDFDSLKLLSGPSDYTTEPAPPRPKPDSDKPWQYARIIKFYPQNTQNWELYFYSPSGEAVPESYDLKKNADSVTGALPAKICTYQWDNKPEQQASPYSITSYSYDSVFLIRQRNEGQPDSVLKSDLPIIKLKSAPFLFKAGYLGITGSLKPVYNKDLAPWQNVDDVVEPGYWENPPSTSRAVITPSRFQAVNFPIRLSIKMGDFYYQGETSRDPNFKSWDTTEKILEWGTIGSSDTKVNSYLDFYDTSTLSMNVNGLKGFAISPSAHDMLYGVMEITIYAPDLPAYYKNGNAGKYPVPFGISLKGLNVSYYKTLTDTGKTNSDRTYENVINKDYINELDTIEFKISSYNDDGSCYSKVMLGNDYLQDNLYNILTTNKRPEELLITRIINRYEHTSVKLTEEINFTGNIVPFTRIRDNYAPMSQKLFIPTGGEIDVAAKRYKCVMVEV